MISFDGTDVQVVTKLRQKSSGVEEAVRVKTDALMIQLSAKIVGEKLHGQVLNQLSGLLAGSVHPVPAKKVGGAIVGEVASSGGPAFYGKVHEYGGKKTFTIIAVNKKALRFLIDGKAIFRTRVERGPLPERSFMRSAATEFEPEIVSQLNEAITLAKLGF